MSKAKIYKSFKVSRLSIFSPGLTMNIREDIITENHLDTLEDSYVLILSKPMYMNVNNGPKKYIRVRFVSIESDLWIPVEAVKLGRS